MFFILLWPPGNSLPIYRPIIFGSILDTTRIGSYSEFYCSGFQLSMNCLLASFFMKMDMGPSENFPLSAGTMLIFVCRGFCRNISGGKDFVFWFWCLLSRLLQGSQLLKGPPTAHVASPSPRTCSRSSFSVARLLQGIRVYIA